MQDPGPLSSCRYVELMIETSAFSFTLTTTNNPPFPGLELMDQKGLTVVLVAYIVFHVCNQQL